jgi:uroporphyrinogen decarboxylase
MNDREWILRTIDRREPVPVPYNFSFSPPALRRVQEHYGADIEEAIALPIRMTGCKSIKPLYADPSQFGPTARDEFGVVWSTTPIDRGSPIGPCLRESTLAGYTFPDPAAAYRFEDIGAWCRLHEGHFRLIWIGDLWERATFMRGMQDILMDVAAEPTFVEALLHGLTDYILRTMEILFARFDFEAVSLSDDYGMQQSLVMSPEDWRKLLKPQVAKIYALAKRHGKIVMHHSCGHIVPIIGDMIDIGLDILHPIQPEAMDCAMLKRRFGMDLTLCGGISTQQLLVHGTAAQVREEVRRLKDVLGKGGGYILEPGITIQDDVPLENLVAMIDEARA